MDECPSCPLCAEELDATDRGFYPCRCRYQVCPFCYVRLKETTAGLCPGCRAPYKDQEPYYEEPDLEKLREEREQQKQKERAEKHQSSKSLESLANVRVIQRNLVYVTGLPLKHAYDEVLASAKWFKPYGRILKCVANRSVQYNSSSPHGPTVSAYVTYADHESALGAIRDLDNTMHEGHVLRCSFGTTKYCNSFLRGAECTIPDCMYLHRIQEHDDTYLRAQLSKGQDSNTRAEFHHKTHPQFQAEQAAAAAAEAAEAAEAAAQAAAPTEQFQPSSSSMQLPAPLPPTRSVGVRAKTPPTRIAPVAVGAAPAEIPAPRPGAKQPVLSKPVPAAIGAKAGDVGRRVWEAPPTDPWGVQNTRSQPAPAPSAVELGASSAPSMASEHDPVASVANAALSSDSLFSAFARSQGPPPGLEGPMQPAGRSMWGQGQPEGAWDADPVGNNPGAAGFGANNNFSLWGGSAPAAATQPYGAAGMWGGVQPGPEGFAAPGAGAPPPQQSSDWDWQSAFRALLPEVNVHFEGSGSQPVPSNNTTTTSNAGSIWGCLLYTSDAADEEDSVDLGGRRIIKKKKKT
eukprot:TRINITY_DN19653_c0_g1_i2.p1 TRINITY_DN19653_c0_g1~~TRINITY_DN19653_c0_g1_i2.p1  ORF type:complete len:573 (+),score=114.21 TRINITY_DN19653_c0_g1_i2:109-1827(+)